MKKEDLLNILVGTKMIDIVTGEELSYLRVTNETVVCSDERNLTIWLPFDRIKIKE